MTNINQGNLPASVARNCYIRLGLRNEQGVQIASVQIDPNRWGHNMIFRTDAGSATIPSGRYAINGRSQAIPSSVHGTYTHRHWRGDLPSLS